MDFPILIIWMSALELIGVLGVIFHFYFIFSMKRMPGLYGLKKSHAANHNHGADSNAFVSKKIFAFVVWCMAKIGFLMTRLRHEKAQT